MSSLSEMAIVLLFSLSVIAIVGMVAVFCLCMYLKVFPKVKHKSEVNSGDTGLDGTSELELDIANRT